MATTLPDILRLYSDKAFRKNVVAGLTNPVVRAFWQSEFAKYPPRYEAEALAPIQNKLGAFLADPMLYRVPVNPVTCAPVRMKGGSRDWCPTQNGAGHLIRGDITIEQPITLAAAIAGLQNRYQCGVASAQFTDRSPPYPIKWRPSTKQESTMQDDAPIDIPTAMLNAITSFIGQGTVDFPPFRFYFGTMNPKGQPLYMPSGSGGFAGWHGLYVTPLPGYEDAVIPAGVPNDEYVNLSPPGMSSWQIHKRYLMPPGSTPPNDSLLINPTMPDANPTYALLLKKNFLDVPGFPVAAPTFDPTFSVGQETVPGIQKVSILFDGAATADGTWNWNGSFRFLVNEAYWVCTSTNSTPEGGSESVTLSVGCSTDDYQRFYDDRKITVSVDAGVIAKMFDFGVSEDMSNEMSMTVIHNEAHSSQTTTQINVVYPKSNLTLFWQGASNLTYYDGSGAIIDTAPIQTMGTRMTWQGETGPQIQIVSD